MHVDVTARPIVYAELHAILNAARPDMFTNADKDKGSVGLIVKKLAGMPKYDKSAPAYPIVATRHDDDE